MKEIMYVKKNKVNFNVHKAYLALDLASHISFSTLCKYALYKFNTERCVQFHKFFCLFVLCIVPLYFILQICIANLQLLFAEAVPMRILIF